MWGLVKITEFSITSEDAIILSCVLNWTCHNGTDYTSHLDQAHSTRQLKSLSLETLMGLLGQIWILLWHTLITSALPSLQGIHAGNFPLISTYCTFMTMWLCSFPLLDMNSMKGEITSGLLTILSLKPSTVPGTYYHSINMCWLHNLNPFIGKLKLWGYLSLVTLLSEACCSKVYMFISTLFERMVTSYSQYD